MQAGCLKTLLADWREGGAAAIKMMRIERPAEYVRVMCSILPKGMLFETSAVSELATMNWIMITSCGASLHQRRLRQEASA